MVNTLITGTVAGFVLVIDPNNEKGKKERIEYNDALEMAVKVRTIKLVEIGRYNADPQNYDMMEASFFTQYRRDDNAVVTEQEGYSPSGEVKVGDLAHLATCKCGKKEWFKLRKEDMSCMSNEFTCEDCNDGDTSIHDHDFTNYDGMQEREY